MPKLRIIYTAALVILGVILVFTVFRPMVTGEKFSEVSRESIVQSEDQWIIQFDIINREGKYANYIINWSTGGETYSSKTVLIENGRTFTNIHHVYPETMKEGKVHLIIWKEGEISLFKETTYYLK